MALLYTVFLRLLLFGFGIYPFAHVAQALETDQFTLPPHPLKDFGPVLEDKVRSILQEVVDETNAKLKSLAIDLSSTNAAKTGTLSSLKRQALIILESEKYIATAYFLKVGVGVPTCTLENWVLQYGGEQLNQWQFKPSWSQSIYKRRPGLYLFTTPVINLFDIQVGVDKIGHLFQQGHTYYLLYEGYLAQGLSPTDALTQAVHVSKFSEETYFGLVLTAGMSRADLAANYAGLKFYLNLTDPLDIPGAQRPILVREDVMIGGIEVKLWHLNPNRPHILGPFITEHLNEVWNPSSYGSINLRLLMPQVRTQCARWVEQEPEFFREAIERRMQQLSTWYGEDYGHPALDSQTLSLVSACF